MGWSTSIPAIKPKAPKQRIDYRDIAWRIRDALTAEEVAERYGYPANSAGFIRCPFHSGDNSPSLKLYPGNRGWNCFGCGEHGTVIDFVMKLYDLDFKQAVQKLNDDFSLHLISSSGMPAVLPPVKKPDHTMLDKKKELEDLYYKIIRLRVHYGDILMKAEHYVEDPENAPEWWLDAALNVTFLDYLMDECCYKLDEVEELLKGDKACD